MLNMKYRARIYYTARDAKTEVRKPLIYDKHLPIQTTFYGLTVCQTHRLG